jgi:class 3 adenylate cyclase
MPRRRDGGAPRVADWIHEGVPLATERACLLIADISGYTSYLAGVELDHAEDILADLTRTIVTALRPGFRLAKLEGDAAFTYAIADTIDGSLLLDTIERCYFGFRRRRRDMRQATSCECNACERIPDLDLKFVVHHGIILRQRFAGREELVGSDVIVAHRLLKNNVVASTGMAAYALFTQACVEAMDVDVADLGMRAAVETYEVIGEVPVWLHDLERRWQDEEARTRVIVDEAQAAFHWDFPTPAPPQVAWEFMTAPGRRVAWQTGVTGVEIAATGNRRGVGAVTHCMHGKSASVEEVLDWRPFDYYTIRNRMPTPMGTLQALQTIEFEPTPDGTIVHLRFGAPASRKELATMEAMLPMLKVGLRSSTASLVQELAAELGRRGGDDSVEPELPLPRPDGTLAGLPGRAPENP